MLISALQQSDSVIHICIHFHILFHYGLSQNIDYSSTWTSFIVQLVKNPPVMQKTPVLLLGWEDPLEKE